MGVTCSKCTGASPEAVRHPGGAAGRHGKMLNHQHRTQESPDPAMQELMIRSCEYTHEQEQLLQQRRQQQHQQNEAKDEAKGGCSNSTTTTSPSQPASSTTTSGQYHLLYKHQKGARKESAAAMSSSSSSTGDKSVQQQQQQQQQQAQRSMQPMEAWAMEQPEPENGENPVPTRLLVRRHSLRNYEEGLSGTHLYAVRYPADKSLDLKSARSAGSPGAACQAQEQYPGSLDDKSKGNKGSSPSASAMATKTTQTKTASAAASAGSGVAGNADPSKTWSPSVPQDGANNKEMYVDNLFKPATMLTQPKRSVVDWTTVSEEHNIYVADTGLTVAASDEIIRVTEQVCRGQYAAYTYAKQTLGCREFPVLAQTCQPVVHTIVSAITEFSRKGNGGSAAARKTLALDDREPHMVKYDVTKKERQKLDMHTDKSEWTFLIALSNGCGLDYEGGGTYFECLDATVHLQRGHALIFPGKLRHCGQRITSGLRFLLVGFLVDKSPPAAYAAIANGGKATTAASATKDGGGSGGTRNADPASPATQASSNASASPSP